VGEGPDGATDFARRHRLARPLEAGAVAPRLVVPERKGQAERGRFGVDAVRAAHLRRALELEGPPPQHRRQRVESFEQQAARVAQEQRVGRVHHVRRGQPVVDEARGLADVFGQGRRERDHVMIGRLLYLADALDREGRLPPYLPHRRGGNGPHLGVDLADGDLHVQPLPEFVLLGPERAHLGQCVAFDHFLERRPSAISF
jgi:hypothetical protein